MFDYSDDYNLLLDTDSYKASHPMQYPPGTEYVYSYVESRGGKFDYTVFFGLQIYLKRYLSRVVTRANIDEAEEFWAAHGEPFYRSQWEYIVDRHDGRLPVCIRAVPEGTVMGTRNVLVTIVNTDPQCYWLTSFLETAILRAVWYGTTACTNSWVCKQAIMAALQQSSDNPDFEIAYKLNDFGARGVSSLESSGIGGAAHLVNFAGTDNVPGVRVAKRYYRAAMPGNSIPAAEHSTITSWGQDHEVDAYRNMIRQFSKPGALYAVVSDSYDFENAVENIWGGVLRDEVLAAGGLLVVRPDSGDPTQVPIWAVQKLSEKFGYTTNSKGYKVVNGVRVIQGDGITVDTIPVILKNLLDAGFAVDNLAFGMGGGMLQQFDRDTQKFAMKCSAICVNGEWRDVYKQPKTDLSKGSKRGRLALVVEDGKYTTVPAQNNMHRDRLLPVFEEGNLLKDWSFDEVRAASNAA